MGKPLGKKFRKGGRNAAFFPQLSGLARGLDKVIEDNSAKAKPTPVSVHQDNINAAEAKRQRKLERNRKLLEKQIIAAGDSSVVSRTMFDKPISVRCDEDLVIDYGNGIAYTENRDE